MVFIVKSAMIIAIIVQNLQNIIALIVITLNLSSLANVCNYAQILLTMMVHPAKVFFIKILSRLNNAFMPPSP